MDSLVVASSAIEHADNNTTPAKPRNLDTPPHTVIPGLLLFMRLTDMLQMDLGLDALSFDEAATGTAVALPEARGRFLSHRWAS